MNPTSTDVHVDAALSDLSISYGAQQYVWDQMFPVVPVDKQSDKYYIWNAADFRRDEGAAVMRAPSALANRGGQRLSTDSYYCDNYAWGKPTPKETSRNADAALRQQQKATAYCTEVVNRRIEMQQVTDCFATSKWGTDVTAGSLDYSSNTVVSWATTATSDPIGNVRHYADEIQKATGLRPNSIMLSRTVLSIILDHPDFIDRLTDQKDRIVQLANIAALFEVDRVVVGQASYNSAAEGATATNAWVHGDNALLYYVPSSPGIDVPSAGYTMQWGPRSVLNYEDTPAGKMTDVVEVHEYVDFEITASALGVFFSDIV